MGNFSAFVYRGTDGKFYYMVRAAGQENVPADCDLITTFHGGEEIDDVAQPAKELVETLQNASPKERAEILKKLRT